MGQRNYHRACTAEEAAILEADLAADIADELSEEEELRDAWFACSAGKCRTRRRMKRKRNLRAPVQNRTETPA